MKPQNPAHAAPADADARKAVKPVICYPVDSLKAPNLELYRAARATSQKVDEVLIPGRDARSFHVPLGSSFASRRSKGRR